MKNMFHKNNPITVSRFHFSPNSFKLKRDLPTPLTNKYSNLKNPCNIKPKMSLWTKLPMKLLLAKYLIPAAAALSIKVLWVENPFQVGLAQYLYKHICSTSALWQILNLQNKLFSRKNGEQEKYEFEWIFWHHCPKYLK